MVKRKGLPEERELVICTISKVNPNAAWCKLDEYTNIEGMIHVSEASAKWVYNIKDVVRVGKQYVAKVVSVESEGKHINLSLKRVSKRDEKGKINQYRKEQGAENILNRVGKHLNKSLDEAYEEIGFILQENFGELSVAFEEIKNNPKILDELNIKENWKNAVIDIINKIFVGKKVKLKAILEIKNYSSDGVDIIKNLLSELEKKSFIVKYISAPKYVVEVNTADPKKTEREMVSSLESLIREMKAKNGEASYKFIK